jgi:hypothetical protein
MDCFLSKDSMRANSTCLNSSHKLKTNPERRHKVKGRTSFAFSDVRRIIAEAGLDPDFSRLCPGLLKA